MICVNAMSWWHLTSHSMSDVIVDLYPRNLRCVPLTFTVHLQVFWNSLHSHSLQYLPFGWIVADSVDYLHLEGLKFSTVYVFAMFPQCALFQLLSVFFLVCISSCVAILSGLSCVLISAISIAVDLIRDTRVSTSSGFVSRAYEACRRVCAFFRFEWVIPL